MRREVIDRQRFQHAVVVAQIVIVLAAPATLAGADRWKSWGEPGVTAQNKPLLVVIGYPTSHLWKPQDHPGFVPVILDRDAHARAADAYTRFANLAGATSDPLHVVLTPHLEPVAAMGSAPPEKVKAFLDQIASRWLTDRDSLVADAGLTVRRFLLSKGGSQQGDAPIVDEVFRSGHAEDRDKALATLRDLMKTARYDHVGGGFFRGTRDAEQRMPYFDKSLLDQARYAIAFTDAWQITRDPLFANVARETLDYIITELPDRSGAFYAGQHADSLVARRGPELLEGGHYVWQTQEIRHLLGAKLGEIVIFHYGLLEDGNVPEQYDPAGDFRGKNVLSSTRPESETRARFGLNEQELAEALKAARQKLLDVRSKRPDPTRHPLIVTAHNGLAVSALARAGVLFDEPRYTDAAVRAARAVLQRNHDAARAKLTRTQGVAAIAEDYALLIRGLLDAYEASFDVSFIERAIALQQQQDQSKGLSGIPDPVVALATEDTYTNNVTGINLVRLAEITGNDSWRARANPPALAVHRQVIIAGQPWRDDTKALLRSIREPFAPHRMIFLIDNHRTAARLAQWMPYAKDVTPVEKQTIATVCQQRTCRTPTTAQDRVIAWLQ